MREAVRLAERVAVTDANVLVTGESGCGKDALSWFIHSRSQRAGETLVKIDCATLPADLLEAELFGYERGAFSGATARFDECESQRRSRAASFSRRSVLSAQRGSHRGAAAA